MLSPNDAVAVVKDRLWPLLRAERDRVARIDKWLRWDHDAPHQPRHATREYKGIAERAEAPWGRRVVGAAVDQMYVDGYRPNDADDDSKPWEWWQANGLDARQIPLHAATVGYGLAYNVIVPGISWLGEKMPVIRGLDPSQMIAVYEDPAWDDWPVYALRVEPTRVGGFKLRLYDDALVHRLVMSTSGDRLQYVKEEAHDLGVCPVVRFTNDLDLRGRAAGDIEPIIPILGRIDQTVFDRLIVQRFASWKVRTVTGMSFADTASTTGETPEQAKLRLKLEDLLIGTNKDTRFGTLDETPLSGFIEAHDADVRALAALSQSPAHELIGQMANLSADALAAAEASLTRRIARIKHPVGEAWEQSLRLAAHAMGDRAAAKDVASSVIWRDMESRSLATAADALGKIATMLGVPVQMLWEDIPGWTQQKVERARKLAETSAAGIDGLMRQLAGAQQPADSKLWVPGAA